MSDRSFAESLFLVAHDPDGRRLVTGTALGFGLTGGLLLDLVRVGAITAEDGGSVVPLAEIDTDRWPSTDREPSARVLEELRASKRPRSMKHWVSKLPGRLRPIDVAVGTGLVERGLVERRRTRVLLIFPATRWVPTDASGAEMLHARLVAVLVDGAEPTEDDALLLALVGPVGLISQLVQRRDRKAAAKRAKAIVTGDATIVSEGIVAAMKAVDAALMATVAASVAATTAATTSN